jgi:hypothetical protein
MSAKSMVLLLRCRSWIAKSALAVRRDREIAIELGKTERVVEREERTWKWSYLGPWSIHFLLADGGF